MIPRANITAWRSIAPWADNDQVEQDLIISRTMLEIFSDESLRQSVAFRGGTALHKLYIEPPSRYSEDIDLVQITEGPIGPMLDRLRNIVGAYLGEARVSHRESSVRLWFRYRSEFPPSATSRLKIEIQTREHFSVMPLEQKPLTVDNPWFEGEGNIITYHIDELLGTKLRALYQRRKGRDLFDLWAALESGLVSAEQVVRCFAEYMGRQGLRVRRAEFEHNLQDKIEDRTFLRDVEPLLRPEVEYSAEVAHGAVMQSLIQRLPE